MSLSPELRGAYEEAARRFESGATARGRKTDLEHRAFTRVVVKSTLAWFSLTPEAHQAAASLLRRCLAEDTRMEDVVE